VPVLSLPVPERFGSRFTVRFLSHTDCPTGTLDGPSKKLRLGSCVASLLVLVSLAARWIATGAPWARNSPEGRQFTKLRYGPASLRGASGCGMVWPQTGAEKDHVPFVIPFSFFHMVGLGSRVAGLLVEIWSFFFQRLFPLNAPLESFGHGAGGIASRCRWRRPKSTRCALPYTVTLGAGTQRAQWLSPPLESQCY